MDAEDLQLPAPIPMALAVVVDRERERILLGRKLTGFGEGKVIAPGGKVEHAESSREAAARELAEETSLTVAPGQLLDVGTVIFFWSDPADAPFQVDLWLATSWEGEATASEELDPFWCPLTQIPFDRTWDDNRIWLPNVLRDERVEAVIGYAPDRTHVASVQMVTRPRQDVTA